MADAPVTVVGCGLPDQAYPTVGGSGDSVDIDVAIALDHLTLAAAAEGLSTCWIGAFDERAVKRLLHVPPQAKTVALMPVGYPSSAELLFAINESQRKSNAEVLATDRFS